MELKDPFAPLVGFDSRKAAQVASYFALRNNGKIEKLKLIKLMYLAERESMIRHDHPMFYDEYYSMKDGPVCSSVLNGINGNIDRSIWNEYVAHNGNIVIPVKRLSRDDMDEVSPAEYAILEELWEKFGRMSASRIRGYTHDHCPEYREVTSGRLPITYEDVFKAVGKKDPSGIASAISEFRKLEAMFHT